MQKKAKKVLVLSAGIIFIILGLVGLVLPFLQGILFLIIGFLIISFYFPKVREHIQKHAQKAPHLSPLINKIEKWIADFVGKI